MDLPRRGHVRRQRHRAQLHRGARLEGARLDLDRAIDATRVAKALAGHAKPWSPLGLSQRLIGPIAFAPAELQLARAAQLLDHPGHLVPMGQ